MFPCYLNSIAGLFITYFKFVNHTNLPFEIHSMLNEARLELCGVATVNSEPLDIALEALYSPMGKFYLKPVGEK